MEKKTVVRNDQLAGVFDRAAGSYGTIGPKYFEYFGSKLVEMAEIRSGAKVLDVACGKGASLFPAFVTVGQKGSVTGIDFSSGMVMSLTDMLNEKGISNIKILHMNAENLDFMDNEFDTILCGLSIQFFSDYQCALNEMYRVLKMGGKIAVSTHKRREGKGLMGRVLPKYFAGISIPLMQPQNIIRPDFGSEEVLINMLADCGFENIVILEEVRKFYYKDEEEWWREQWSHGGRAHLELVAQMGSETLQELKTELFEGLRENKDDHGIPYDASVLFAFGTK